MSNFQWTLIHLNELSKEWSYRFDKPRHFTQDFFDWCEKNLPDLSREDKTTQPQCFVKSFPECIVDGNPVAGYRNYYNKAKTQFQFGKQIKYATWTKRDKPEWFKPYQSLQA
jgi:hypothetical protein